LVRLLMALIKIGLFVGRSARCMSEKRRLPPRWPTIGIAGGDPAYRRTMPKIARAGVEERPPTSAGHWSRRSRPGSRRSRVCASRRRRGEARLSRHASERDIPYDSSQAIRQAAIDRNRQRPFAAAVVVGLSAFNTAHRRFGTTLSTTQCRRTNISAPNAGKERAGAILAGAHQRSRPTGAPTTRWHQAGLVGFGPVSPCPVNEARQRALSGARYS